MTYKLYDILEVSRNASQEDIKKNYKKLAFQFHPDKNKGNKDAEIKFKEISNAYSILSNPETKERYDHLGDENFNNDSGGNNQHEAANMDEIFQHLFGSRRGGFNPFGDFGQNNICNNIIKHYNITLEDIYNGISKTVKITLNKYCTKCFTTCTTCKGSGMIQQIMQVGPMTQIFNMTCNKCGGAKIMNKNNKDCKECKGNGTFEVEQTAVLNMPKGFDSNHTIFEGFGEQPQTPGQKPGNLIFEFRLMQHALFSKQGNDLYYKHTLTLTESIIGKLITIEYFGEQIKINTNQFGIINPSKQYILKNRGLPIYNTQKKGNMIIEFNITYPQLNTTELDNLTVLLNKAFLY
uniref:J domain-containing protein n=1 Tax=viral metagenome TaxID=1070528 RepID=A0A6C0LI44_9ZZZZ